MVNKRIAALLFVVIGGCADSASTTPTTGTTKQAVTTASPEVSKSFLNGAKALKSRQAPHTKALGGAPSALASTSRQIQTGIDSLTSVSGQFTAAGFDDVGNPQSVWPFTMVGRDPALG